MTDEAALAVHEGRLPRDGAAVWPARSAHEVLHAVFLPRLAVLGVSLYEALAWAVLVGLALVSRFLLLGSPPLDVAESARALAAYALLHEGRTAYEGGPILTNLTSLVFGLFAEGDLQARLLPALSGVVLVLAPLLLRPVLGGWWSLAASAAFLGSSVLLTTSRTLAPTVPVACCLAVTALAFWRFGLSHQRGWLLAAAIALFVGVGIDTAFVVGLLGLLLAYAIAEGDIFGRAPWWTPVGRHGRLALAVGLGTAAVLATRFLMNPQGLQFGLIDPLTRWTGDVARGAGLTAPLLLLMLDGAVVILALVGLLEYARHPRPVRFLGTWLLVSLTLASLMRMPELRYLALPVVPAALLAGFGLLKLGRWLVEAGSTRTSVIGLLGLVPVVTASFQVNAGINANQSPWSDASVVLVAGLLLVGLLAFNVLRGKEYGAAFATWLLVLLVVGQTAGAMRALGARGDDRGQLAEQSVVTADIQVIRELALKWHRADPNGVIPVDPTLRPLVEWQLRGIPTVRYAVAPDAAGPRILADAPEAVAPDTRTTRWIVGYAPDWQSLALQPSRVWRWIVQRASLVTLRPYGIVVVQPPGS